MNKLEALPGVNVATSPTWGEVSKGAHASFEAVLQSKRGVDVRGVTDSPIIGQLEHFIVQWDQVHRASDKLLAQVPLEYRKFVELQYLVNDLNLRANLITKAGETVTATINRIQQMGGS